MPQPPPPPLESLLPSAITTLSLSPIPPGFSQPMMYVELCRIGVGYLVDFLHLDHFAHEAIVNLNNPQAAVAAAQVGRGLLAFFFLPLHAHPSQFVLPNFCQHSPVVEVLMQVHA